MKNFLKTKLNISKKTFKKISKKPFFKIGLFLIFGLIVLNLNLGTNKSIRNAFSRNVFVAHLNVSSAMTDAEARAMRLESIERAAQAMGFTTDGNGSVEDLNLGSPTAAGGAALAVVFKGLLWGVLTAVSELAKYAGLLLDVALRQDYFTAFVDNEGVYDGWVIVRDLLNMFFMLLLLFSAFATIFQVEKYHLRKIIIMLVVMALLVNFSFPVARVVIDFSNSVMYFLIENSFGENASYSAKINSFTELGKTIGSTSQIKDEIAVYILNIILTFVVAITFFAIAMNLIIRMLAFVILLILAPAGFVFAFFTDTKNLSNDWWSALFKYAFMGPAMAFFLYLAMSIFDGSSSMVTNNSFFSKEFVKFSVPIAFLWMGLVASSKFGGSGSSMAMGFAKKTGNNIKSYGQKAAWGAAGAVGRYADDKSGNVVSGSIGAAKMKLAQWNDDHKKSSNTKATELADKIGVEGANEKLVQESRKKWKEAGGLDDLEAARIETGGTTAEKMALALERAETKGFDKDPAKAFTQYQAGLAAIGNNKVYKDIFESNSKKKHIDLVVRQEIETKNAASITAGTGPLTSAQRITHAEEVFSKLSPTQWKDQNMERLVDATTPHSADIINAAKAVINGRPTGPGGTMLGGYSTKAKENLANDMEKKKYAYGQSASLWS